MDPGLESWPAWTSGLGLQRRHSWGSRWNRHNADASRGCKSARNSGESCCKQNLELFTSRWLECGFKTGLAKLSLTLELGFSGIGGGTKPGIQTWTQWSGRFLFFPTIIIVSLRDLDAEGVKVTAYVTAHLNVEGDVYAEAAAVSSQFFLHSSFLFPKITSSNHPGGSLAEIWKWLTGGLMIRSFEWFPLIFSFNKTTVTSQLLQWT